MTRTSSEEFGLKARECVSQMFKALNDNDVVSDLYRSLHMPAESLGANPGKVFDEIACFGAFSMAVCATQYIKKRGLFVRNEPDKAGADQFSNYVFQHLTQMLESRPSRERYHFYMQYKDPNFTPESHPFTDLASMRPNRQAFETRFVDYKFKVQVFATHLARIIQGSVPPAAQRVPPNASLRDSAIMMKQWLANKGGAVDPSDLVPFGRRMAEQAADITKEVFLKP